MAAATAEGGLDSIANIFEVPKPEMPPPHMPV